MKVVSIKPQEDCFDRSIMKVVLFDQPIKPNFIYFWKSKGELSYFPSFSRPFFKVDVKGHYFLKGIEDNNSAKLTLYKKNPEINLQVFLNHIEDYSCHIPYKSIISG
jgi:hypothetical protein